MAAGEFADWQDSLRQRLTSVTRPNEFEEIVEKLSTGILFPARWCKVIQIKRFEHHRFACQSCQTISLWKQRLL